MIASSLRVFARSARRADRSDSGSFSARCSARRARVSSLVMARHNNPLARRVNLAAIVTALAFVTPAHAAGLCMPSAAPRAAIEKAPGGKWIALTHDQRLFLAGVYVMNPRTPAGLPLGDGAALAQVPGDKGGLVFFIDGDKACTPMALPDQVIDMLQHLDDVSHEGDKS